MKTVIYHSADFDGIFCREVAKHFLGTEGVTFIGWNHGDPLLPFPSEGDVYVLDLSPDCFDLPCGGTDYQRRYERLIWIDHHKSSIEKFNTSIPGYRIDGVAACRLAWQWFKFNGEPSSTLNHFVGRIVDEPIAVRLAGEYDIWDKRDPRAEVFQFGLRSRELTEFDWTQILSTERPTIEEVERLIAVGHFQDMIEPDGTHCPAIVHGLLMDGKTLQRYQQKADADVVTSRSFMVEWEGLKFLCLNSARFNSLTFAVKDVPETGHDALLGFCFTGEKYTVSLYHANHRKDLDLSLIAVKNGGGGHRGACGFTCKILPFLK